LLRDELSAIFAAEDPHEALRLVHSAPQTPRKTLMNTTTLNFNSLMPLIMHSGRLADPLDPASQMLKKLTDKKKKTHSDHLEVSKCEWYGSLYVDDDGKPCLPGEVLEACLVEGARKFKLGKVAKGGLVVLGNFALQFNGPKTADELWENGGYLKRAGVRIGQQRIIRSRPIFPAWACSFEVMWDPGLITDEGQLFDIARSAGQSGIGDWRPKFGRFEVS